eukprot:5625242-Alexandrium_andersonii.AAC.1
MCIRDSLLPLRLDGLNLLGPQLAQVILGRGHGGEQAGEGLELGDDKLAQPLQVSLRLDLAQ